MDVAVKTVLLLLESKTKSTNSMFEAIEMLNQVLKVAVLDQENDETLKSSLRLQLDNLFGSFNGILTTTG